MSDTPIYFADHNPLMVWANHSSRQTFKYFWRELSWEYRRIIPGLDVAAVKMPFPVADGLPDAPEVEQIWLGEIEFNGNMTRGVVLNQPQWVDDLEMGSDVDWPLDKISDWIYAIGGQVYGAYTVNVVRSQLTPLELEQHDAAWGLHFGNPDIIQVTPATPVPLQEGAEFDDDAEPEHPMSENMAEKIEQALAADPTLATSVDDLDWSLLHREALAGNLTPVQILLRYGADPTVPNPQGESAIALAQKMHWPKILKVLGE